MDCTKRLRKAKPVVDAEFSHTHNHRSNIEQSYCRRLTQCPCFLCCGASQLLYVVALSVSRSSASNLLDR